MNTRNTPKISMHMPFDLVGDCVETYEKKVRDLMASYTKNIPVELSEKIAYRVASIPASVPVFGGTLSFGITYLNPYKIEGEYSMTRGHFHQDRTCDEYYFGLSGQGFLLLWDGQDDVLTESVFPGSVHYINGKYAHRLINIDDHETLAVGACWNTSAGHDYETINRLGFPVRCFEINDQPTWVSDPNHK